MARFEIIEEQNTRFVRALLEDSAIRAEAGALSYFRGKVTMRAPVPGPIQLMRSSISDEAAIRPVFSGTGEVVLEASTGGFHAFELRDHPWILERGAYWASDETVKLTVFREKVWNSVLQGTGLIDFCTEVSGEGTVVLSAPGPVEEVELGDEDFAIDGRFVIARSHRVRYSLRRPSRSILSSWLSGERLLRVYHGPGRILVATTPYWHQLLYQKLGS